MQVLPIARVNDDLLRDRKPRRQMRPDAPRPTTLVNDPTAPRFVVFA